MPRVTVGEALPKEALASGTRPQLNTIKTSPGSPPGAACFFLQTVIRDFSQRLVKQPEFAFAATVRWHDVDRVAERPDQQIA
jgi:hypothetical protein